MEQPALLEMRGICKEFPGVKALDNVDLTVRPGTVHALMGENGAGKSTLMKCLFGIYRRDAGTITLVMAQKAKRAIGAEIVPEAVENARENARRNGLENAEFFCGDAGAVAEKLAREGVRPQMICVDPPRKGLGEEVPAVLAGMAPDRIVYVSCDPATLARDVKRFGALGYGAVRAQGVDLFPRCAHVETVILLQRENW